MQVTCYGGVGEIGGNKILLEDGGSAIMLDFGKSFRADSDYFNEFLKPRTNSALRDLLALGLIPAIPGIYRHDLLRHAGAWDELCGCGDPLPQSAECLYSVDLASHRDHVGRSGKPRLDGVLLSHAHADHVQHLSFVDPEIPVFCTQATLDILRACQAVGQSGHESDICVCRERAVKRCGDRSTFPGAFEVSSENKVGRDIRAVAPLQEFRVGAFTVQPVLVDHSVPGACAYLITGPSGKRLFYTGDVRFHGRMDGLTAGLREFAAGLRPDVLITEGTRIRAGDGGGYRTGLGSDNELGVESHICDAVRGCSGLAIIDFGWKDTSRFQTVWNVARATGRTLVVSPKLAYLWNVLHLSDPGAFPPLGQDGSVKVYFERADSMTYSPADYSGVSKYKLGLDLDWEKTQMQKAWKDGDTGYLHRVLCHYYQGVRAFHIAENPSEYILHAGYFDITEMFDVRPPAGSLFIRAATDPFSDEMEIDARKMANWLDHFGIAYEKNEDGDQVSGAGSHVSGHATADDLFPFIADMSPEVVIPVHTEHPRAFADQLGGRSEVVVPAPGKTIEL